MPVWYCAYALRTRTDEELDKGTGLVLLGEFLLVARHPAHWDGPINTHARFVDSYFGESPVVAGNFQGHESTEAVANEQGRAGLLLQGEHILTFFEHAVIITLWAAQTSPATFNDVDGKMLGQSTRKGSVVGSYGERAGNNQNRWPTSHGEIANLRPILGEHGVGGCSHVTCGHHFSFFIFVIRAWCNRSESSR